MCVARDRGAVGRRGRPRTVDLGRTQEPEIFPAGGRLYRILQSVDFAGEQRLQISNGKDSLQSLQWMDCPAQYQYIEAALHLPIRIRPHGHCPDAGGPFTWKVA